MKMHGELLNKALKCAYEYWPVIGAPAEQTALLAEKRKEKVREGVKLWRAKLFAMIGNALPSFELIDRSDDEGDSCCVWYSLLLHENHPLMDDDEDLLNSLGGIRYDLNIYCSMLAPFYFIECVRTRLESLQDGERWDFARVPNSIPHVEQIVSKILQGEGFIKLTRRIVTYPVPDLQMPFTDPSDAILFGGLFEDLFAKSVKRGQRTWLQEGGHTWCSW